jgi:hypothetical protein
MCRLRELLIVYTLDEMNPDSVSFQQNGSKEMEFVEALPERGSGNFWVVITELPRREDAGAGGLGGEKYYEKYSAGLWVEGAWPVVSRLRRGSLLGQTRSVVLREMKFGADFLILHWQE